MVYPKATPTSRGRTRVTGERRPVLGDQGAWLAIARGRPAAEGRCARTQRVSVRSAVRPAVLIAAAITIAACGSGAPVAASSDRSSPAAIPPASESAPRRLLDWPEFGLNPQRSASSDASTGITAATASRMRRTRVPLPGAIDSAPIYLHTVSVGGAGHSVFVVTSSYGRTFAVDANSGRVLWSFTPPGYASWAGSDQVTTASPLADPDRRSVYTTSPDGLIHKLSLSDGHEQAGWPVSVTRLASREKLSSALNIAGRYVVAVTGGYFGDAPPYQGHVALIDRARARVVAAYNTLCADRRGIIAPSDCSASGSAIWAREGAVIERGGARLLVATGNGPYNGRTNFGDSVLELTLPGLSLRQAFTPVDQARLNASDTDLGSSAPALLSSHLTAIAGKDGVLRLLHLDRLDGHPPSAAHSTGGEAQTLATPGGAGLYSSPAVWSHSGHVTLFVADSSGTGAYALRSGRLQQVWTSPSPGNSPVLAGGLLYVYDPADGGVKVYRPNSPRPVADLSCPPGHWSSAIVADGHVAVGEGNYMDHSQSGALDIWSA